MTRQTKVCPRCRRLRTIQARGFCASCYSTLNQQGAFLNKKLKLTLDAWFDRVDRSNHAACWPWPGPMLENGYGRSKKNDRLVLAHREAYIRANGAINDGLQVHHICHEMDNTCKGGWSCPHRACVNPSHLKATSAKDNVLCGLGHTAVNAVKTHCIHGHEFNAQNTLIRRNGNRSCRKCACIKQRIYRARHKATA
jgi:hypothetical protein